MEKMSNKDKNEWGSNLSFLLAMIGSAVGLGNIWRYPYVLYANGGGAFYIPYIVAILLMGVPFLILEYGVGYNYKSSFAKALTKINSRCEYLGWFLPVAVFMILIYYSTILGWDGIYVILSFFKGWGSKGRKRGENGRRAILRPGWTPRSSETSRRRRWTGSMPINARSFRTTHVSASA